jgi:hypothetical protein
MGLLFLCEDDAPPAPPPRAASTFVSRFLLKVEECCSWCRQPVVHCRQSSCDSAGTYSGTLVRGEWRPAEPAPVATDEPEREGDPAGTEPPS